MYNLYHALRLCYINVGLFKKYFLKNCVFIKFIYLTYLMSQILRMMYS